MGEQLDADPLLGLHPQQAPDDQLTEEILRAARQHVASARSVMKRAEDSARQARSEMARVRSEIGLVFIKVDWYAPKNPKVVGQTEEEEKKIEVFAYTRLAAYLEEHRTRADDQLTEEILR